MQWYAVLNPFGFDAFGLPTENYAIQEWKPARQVTDENKQKFLDQVQALNMSFDLSRIIDTSTPEYYKRTQRIFLKLYEAGLAYRDTLRVNRCPKDLTVLANDQVVDGKCERCKSEITQKKHPQWFIKITDYADRLITDLDLVDRPEETKIAQKNRIGRSEWAEIDFDVVQWEHKKTITCFTTRPDTIYGVTALVIAPESTMLDDILSDERRSEVEQYRQETLAKTSVQRQKDLKEKTWVDSWLFALHPLTNERIPIRYADYVLAGYGSGAVMSVPAHDGRDGEFARKFGIEVKQVIKPMLSNNDFEKIVFKKRSWYWWIQRKTDWKYLVIQANWKISLPWWWVDEWEELQEWTLREIREETGYINTTILSSLIEVDSTYFTPKVDGWIHNRWSFFEVHIEDEERVEPKLTEFEAWRDLQAVWLTKEEILEHDKNDIRTEIFKFLLWTEVILKWVLINSWDFDDLGYKEAQKKIISHLEKLWCGRPKITYKLRDRSVSRQRYRGSPIPVWYDQKWDHHAIPESELPIILPLDLENYQPSGKSPLEDHPEFPKYEKWTRECDTLDTFMCSSFYFLRFPDAGNPDALIREELRNNMFPVDFYSGGKEHTVGHLLYSRFIHKFLFDQWYVGSPEPFAKLVHQGMVLGTDGRKMGKRYGNWVDPLEVVAKYSADAVRTYMMFMWPVEADKLWSDTALHGMSKFLRRVEALLDKDWRWNKDQDVTSAIHIAIQGITSDIEQLKLNTCVSKLMILVNTIYEKEAVTDIQLNILARLLAPFATDLAEKMHTDAWGEWDVHFATRPEHDESKIIQSSITLPVQINGKVRAKIELTPGWSESEVVELASQHENISKRLEDKEIKKIIYVEDKILNLIVN